MDVASWNINSIRAREERVGEWLDSLEPDVVCFQETKVKDEEFPRDLFLDRGYTLEVFGQRTYNGVAIAARSGLELEDVVRGLPDETEADDKRLLSATVGDLRVVNVYVPNGRAVGTEAYSFKLAWFQRVRSWLDDTFSPGDSLVICGDFNVAPDDRDVYDVDKWRGRILFSEPEHEALRHLMDFGLTDLQRCFTEDAGLYTWWDYRRLGFPKNKGLRIDLFLATESARQRCTGVRIDREARKGTKPSDHAPVIATF